MNSIEALLRKAGVRAADSTASPRALTPAVLVGAQIDFRQAEIEAEIVCLYEKNASALLRYGLTICGDLEMAQDAVQEAFLRYYVALRKEIDNSDARGWLYSTTRNYILDRLKEYYFRNGRSLDEASHLMENQHGPEETIIMNEIGDRARQVLSPRELQCLRLRHEGLRYQDIADTLGIDTGTVGAFLARALKKMRTALSPRENEK
jgi:RNA polymerase sigma-70 factor, ECF subfamily